MNHHIAIILPIFNEEKNIALMYDALKKVLDALPDYSYELIFVNDGSHDNSWQLIEQLAHHNHQVKGISLSRNFGHQAALMAGYQAVIHADAVITMDADLQDPPALLPTLLQKWRRGAAIVYARRADRKDSFLKRITAHWYYKLLDHITDIKIPRNVGDFRLLDASVLNYVKQCSEKFPYLRGIVAWSGFNHDFVDFKRPNRSYGQTGYTWSKMIHLAFDGVTSFSLFPLKLAAFMAIFIIATGSAMFLYITIDAFCYNIYYPLFKWLTTIIYIFMGIQFLLLWILGEYIGRIFEQQNNRPLYIIRKKINFEKNSNNAIIAKENKTNVSP